MPDWFGLTGERQNSSLYRNCDTGGVHVKTHSSMLHVRMDTEMKRKATAALAAMGLTASEAVRLFFHRIAVDQAFPLDSRCRMPEREVRWPSRRR